MLLKKLVYIFLFLSLQFVALAGDNNDKGKANTRVVAGKVTDNFGEAIPGSKITIKETGESVYADLDGHFTFSIKTDKVYVLLVETIGYQPKELKSTDLAAFPELSLQSL